MNSLTGELASATVDWMAENHSREDAYGDVIAYCLATFVDGTAITPRGFEETDKFATETAVRTGGSNYRFDTDRGGPE